MLTKVMTVRVPMDLYEDLQTQARARGLNTTTFVRRLITGEAQASLADRVGGMESDFENLDRRLARLEEMAGV